MGSNNLDEALRFMANPEIPNCTVHLTQSSMPQHEVGHNGGSEVLSCEILL